MDELVVQAGESGTFQVRARYSSVVQANPILIFDFEYVMKNEDGTPTVVCSTVTSESVKMLHEFLERQILEFERVRGHSFHEFEPYNAKWAKPRCKICTQFEDHPIHKD